MNLLKILLLASFLSVSARPESTGRMRVRKKDKARGKSSKGGKGSKGVDLSFSGHSGHSGKSDKGSKGSKVYSSPTSHSGHTGKSSKVASSYSKGSKGAHFSFSGHSGHTGKSEERPGGLDPKSGKDDRDRKTQTLTLNVINEAFDQPLGPFFVMVHSSDAEPLYVRGKLASEPLATLAEQGSPADLVEHYTTISTDGVLTVEAFAEGAPYKLGDEVAIEVEVSEEYPLVTIASMAINTNDCFVSLNGVEVYDGKVVDVPGLDAGSEENNEECDSVPGPACPEGSGNVRSGNGEGYVHVHRGVFGVGDLEQKQYDWRNPMMRVVVSA